jgi:hypothetical protein
MGAGDKKVAKTTVAVVAVSVAVQLVGVAKSWFVV